MIHHPSTLTVLIVSNHERLAAVLQREVRSRGHLAITVKTGQDAMAMAGTSFQDLILLDSKLRGEDSIEIARELLGIRPVTIVMMAAAVREITEARASGVEIRGYLQKPFDTPQFWSGIRDALETHNGAQGEVSLISAAYDESAFEEAVCKAAQIGVKRMNCSAVAAFERVAEVAAARADRLRKEMCEGRAA
jgi:DNA-binding response OmpR family regulator